MNVIEGIKAVAVVLKPIAEFIEVIEEKLGAGKGQEKLAAVLEFAKSLLGSLGEVPAVVQTVIAFVNGIVAAFNKAGIFKKSA